MSATTKPPTELQAEVDVAAQAMAVAGWKLMRWRCLKQAELIESILPMLERGENSSAMKPLFDVAKLHRENAPAMKTIFGSGEE